MRRSDGEESGGGARKERRKRRKEKDFAPPPLSSPSLLRIFCSPSHWSKTNIQNRNIEKLLNDN